MSAHTKTLGFCATVGLLFGLGTACGDGGPGEELNESSRPSVLLVTVDTLRADHLGAYSKQDSHTPRLDRFADQAMVFERAATPMPLTRPAHFSILTSRYPREHGVLNNALALPESATTLAELFRAAGYRTGGFVAVALLSREAGAAQGFDEFASPEGAKHRSGNEVVAQALDFMTADDSPFFLWVHLFEPHLPYSPPPEYRGDLSPELASSLPDVSWKKLRKIADDNAGDVPQEVLEHAKALYRGEVSYVDHWLGELLDGFDRARDRQHSVVVVTADHGECFEDGVYFEHADCLNEGAVRIPLIVRHSDFAPGTRFGGQVSSIDVAPTILRSARLAIPGEFSGRALQDQSEQEDRYVLIQHPFYQPRVADGRTRRQQQIRSVAGRPTVQILTDEERVGIVGRSWKLIRAGDATELYSQSVPTGARTGERQTDAIQHSDVTTELGTKLQEQLDRHELTILDRGQINDELKETLRALGYLDDGEG